MSKPRVKSKSKSKVKRKLKSTVAVKRKATAKMSKLKAKKKLKAKTKVKAKAKLKTKTKVKGKAKLKAKKIKTKTKLKAKTKVKAKAKLKAKTKVKAKAKLKAKTKVRAKTKVKTKTKIKASSKGKTKLKSKIKLAKQFKSDFSEPQKAQLLDAIQQIIDLRKNTIDGLKSLDAIDHILDPYNQKYTDTHAKFDAIVNFAVIEHAQYVSDSGLIAFKDTGKDSIALYALLAEIGEGKAQFSDANNKIRAIYEDSLTNAVEE